MHIAFLFLQFVVLFEGHHLLEKGVRGENGQLETGCHFAGCLEKARSEKYVQVVGPENSIKIQVEYELRPKSRALENTKNNPSHSHTKHCAA